MRRICVFCGSSPGSKPEYTVAAQALGRTIAERNLGLVYGGARIGLMGAIADAVLERGGEVIGVIPAGLAAKEVAHEGLTALHVVHSMHERKARMAELADGFIAMPGGMGTFEEFFEVLTWAQLGLHHKPCGLLNVCAYFDKLCSFLDAAVAERFLKPEHRQMIYVSESGEQLLDAIATHRPTLVRKWLDAGEI